MIYIGSVSINDKTKQYVNEALDEGRIGQGKFTNLFQESMQDYFGVKHAFFVANGTLADAVSLASLKVLKPERDEVIVPSFTFIAQVNAIKMVGLKPVFVDAGDRFNMDVGKIEEKITDKTLAIMPVHLIGIPADMGAIKSIAFRHNVFVVEDSCESFGAMWEEKLTGTWGDIGTFSFFVSHTITTGEGGLIITDNDELADIIKSVMNHGRKGDEILDKFKFDRFGFNAKATNLQAAIGYSLVDDINPIIHKRRENVDYLNEKLKSFDYSDRAFEFISPHCYPIETTCQEERDATILRLWDAEIECRTLYNSIPNNTYLSSGELFKNSLDYSTKWYYLPIHQDLTKEDLDYMVSKI